MIGSDVDVEIDGNKFQLDRKTDISFTFGGHGPYMHDFEPLTVQRTDISGRPGVQNIRSDLQLWTFDDWSGGEGNEFFSPGDPTIYDTGFCNPRRPGLLTSAPTRTDSIVTSTTVTPFYCFSAIAGNAVWASDGDKLWRSTNGTTWTLKPPSLGANETITAMAGDDNWLYFAVFNDTANTRYIKQISGSSPAAVFSTTTGTVTFPFTSLAFQEGFLYGLAGGGTLDKWATTAAPPVALTQLYSTHVDVAAPGRTGEIVATDNGVAFYSASKGQTNVYEWVSFGSPLWTPPKGFTANAITFVNGVLYLAGNLDNYAFLYAFSMVSKQPIPIGYIRYGTNLTPAWAAPGIGAQAMIGMESGEVFIYDSDKDAFSQLDTLTVPSGTFSTSGITFDGRRMAFITGNDATTLSAAVWGSDNQPSGDFSMTTGAFDFDLPEEEKVLDSISGNMVDLSSQSLSVSYQKNEDGTWISQPAITSGHNFSLPVSDSGNTVKFSTLRLRVDGVNAPKLYNVTAKARLLGYQETFTLLLRMYSDSSTEHPTARQLKASQLRRNLLSTARSKQVVTFKDGIPWAGHNEFDTYDVIVTEPRDVILAGNNQGALKVKLLVVSGPK